MRGGNDNNNTENAIGLAGVERISAPDFGWL
jgi:hypothetical protein